MPKIQVLAPHVADLIAAGEVVERPASVAKELMENAIDAGARAITVEISHGGMTFLRVTDDGRGIEAEELPTAFLRHATSKLRTAFDLEAIGTLGFRGEALAAISAVSRIDVMSRTPEAGLGASLSLEGGQPGPVEEAGCPVGTTVVVRDLFFNTPARLKFMKKDAAEGAAVFGVVQRVALSHPEVSVKFIRDGRQELLTPGDGRLQSAVYAVLGRELALGFCPVRGSSEEMTVTGFTSLPACCRGSRNWQFFFVNGRQVKSKLLTAALEEAYKNQKMVGRFPGCVLHLEVKLSAVDVNVHPAKTEVKFSSERQAFSAVYHAVLSALEGDRTRPAMTLSQPQTQPVEEAVREEQPPKPNPRLVVESPGAAPQPVVSAPQAARPKRPSFTYVSNSQPIPARPVTIPKPAPVREEKPAVEKPKPPVENSVEKGEKCAPAVERPRPLPETPPLLPDPQPLLPQQPAWRMAGEVLNTYVVVEQGERVYFIDKHAAHERMNFDRMKAEGYHPMAQTLLTPVVCPLTAEEQALLLAHRPLLEEFGFEVDELGSKLVVRQAPFDVGAEDIPATLEEIAQRLAATGTADPAAARDELLHTMACKAAIKGGWRTSEKELLRVVEAVMEGSVKYCPHGRPVAIELTKKELEKQFKRA